MADPIPIHRKARRKANTHQVHQPGLFDTHPMARRGDHDSSHQAADAHQASGRADSERQTALRLVKRYPGLTSKLLAEKSGIDRHVLARRLPELADRGLIEKVKQPGKHLTWRPL